MKKFILQIMILLSLIICSYSQNNATHEKNNKEPNDISRSAENSSSKKPLLNIDQREVYERASKRPKLKDITGTDKASGQSAHFDEKYYEMAKAYNLSAFAQPSQDRLDEMLFEFNMKKYLKWAGMILGLILILFLVIKIAKSSSKKSTTTN